MIRSVTLAAACLAALSLAVGLVSPAVAADGPPREGSSGDAPPADPVVLDWYFREIGSGKVVTFQKETSWRTTTLTCDLGGGDLISWWEDGTLHLGGNDGVQVRFGRGDQGIYAPDEAFCGDWDGDGIDTPGSRRGNTVYLAGSNRDGGAPVTSFTFGRADDRRLLVGDWDGNGTDTIAIHRGSSTFLFASSNTTGGGQVSSLLYGRKYDYALAGNFDGSGVDTLAVSRIDNQVFVTFDRPGGTARTAETFSYDRPGHMRTVVAGQLSGAERASVGFGFRKY